MAKIFQHYLEFPEEVRKVVINEMKPDDRCRFTRCSKLSQNEAQKCKKYIYGMKFEVYLEYSMNFSVIYHEKHRNSENGDYNMHFLEGYDGNKYIVYSNRLGVELWRTQLDISKNLMKYVCEIFKNMLNIYQNRVKKLGLQGTSNYDFEIRSLRNLESLTIGDNTDIRQIMSKIQKPLKEFVYYQSISRSFTRDFEQIFKVQNVLSASGIHLDYAQFLQLSAPNITIDIGILTEENVSDFIQSWQNYKIRKNFISCRWNINRSRFDVQKLFRLLEIHEDVGRRWATIDIGHNTDAAKKAKLVSDFEKLIFRVLIQ